MTMIVAANLVHVVSLQERFDEAADIALDALQIGRKVILSETPSKRARGIDQIADNMFFLSWAMSSHSDPNKQNPKKALELARAVIKLRPKRPNYWRVLGMALYRNGQWAKAVESFQKAGEILKDQDMNFHMFLAMAHWQLGNNELAKAIFAQGAAFIDIGFRNSKESIHSKEQLRLRSEAEELMSLTEKDRKQLIADFYLVAERRHPWFFTARGFWHQDRGDYQMAVEDFRTAVDADETDFAERQLIRLLLRQGKARDAIRELPDIDELETSTDFLRKASLIAYAGGEMLYRQLCQHMLERFANSDNVGDIEKTCKVCSLLPDIIDMPGVPLESLENALHDDRTSAEHSCWKSIASALANYRKGDAQQAIEFIRAAKTRNKYAETPQARALATAVLAMAEHQLGNPDLANEALREAAELIEEHWPKMLDDEYGGSWPDWIIAETLHREAAALLSTDEI